MDQLCSRAPNDYTPIHHTHFNFGMKFFQTGDNIMAHTNFLLSCNISHYGKGNRSRLTLLQRCSTHTIMYCNQFVQIPYLPPPLLASRATDNLVPRSHSLDQLPSYRILAHVLMLILLPYSTSFSRSHLSNDLSSFVSLSSRTFLAAVPDLFLDTITLVMPLSPGHRVSPITSGSTIFSYSFPLSPPHISFTIKSVGLYSCKSLE